VRPKIIIVVLLAGLAGCVGIFFLKHMVAPTQSVPITVSTQSVVPVVPPTSPITSNAAPVMPVATFADAPVVKTISHAAANTNALTEEHDAYVQAEIDKLTELQANDDADSLHAILGDLTNSDKEIRAAAVESTIQFGSRDAIPVLQDQAAHTDDPNEKKDLLDAADFLALPTASEAREESRRAKMQNAAPPQDASPAPGQP
jgi:hypothetical protein